MNFDFLRHRITTNLAFLVNDSSSAQCIELKYKSEEAEVEDGHQSRLIMNTAYLV